MAASSLDATQQHTPPTAGYAIAAIAFVSLSHLALFFSVLPLFPYFISKETISHLLTFLKPPTVCLESGGKKIFTYSAILGWIVSIL